VPELPEVEVVRLGLAPAVAGARVSGIEVLDARGVRRHAAGPADFERRLTNAVLREPRRRGKFLWIPLEDGALALLVHLGMSGQVLLRSAEQPPLRHTRVVIGLDTPAVGPLALHFVDQRTFGSLALDPLDPARLVPAQVAHIAPDPLEPAFDDRAFVTALRAKRTTVKRALLDQTLVSGIGNIYADEALWGARVHPEQPTATLSASRARRLIEEVREVMLRALAEGGTSFDALYINVNGESGYFSRSLRAYGRHGLPCERCGASLVREAFMNRGSHYCPRCQRRPRATARTGDSAAGA